MAQISFLLGVCIVSIALRLVDSPISNFSSMIALALFSGAVIRHPAAFLLPVAIRAVTDLLIQAKTGYGFFASWPFDYAAYAAIFLFATYSVRPHRTASIAGGSIVAVCTYFILSNLGVWIMTDMYPQTAAGLMECFTLAIPFARGTVLGNLIAVPIFFAGWNLLAVPATTAETVGGTIATANKDA